MKTSLKKLAQEHPVEGLAFLLGQLEAAGVIKEGEKVSFQFPEALQKAASEGVDIFTLENLVKILGITITGEPDQVVYGFISMNVLSWENKEDSDNGR